MFGLPEEMRSFWVELGLGSGTEEPVCACLFDWGRHLEVAVSGMKY